MSQANAHFLVIQDALERIIPALWEEYANYAGFGSFGPDLFYVHGVPNVLGLQRVNPRGYDKVSDFIHREGSLDFFCSMMDSIKKTEASKQGKLKAFAYGYYSHVVTDAIFHPFIYLKSGDQFENHKDKYYDRHKRLEALKDAYFLGRRGFDAFNFGYEERVICHAQNSNRSLDQDVFNLLNGSMERIYGPLLSQGGIDYDFYFSRFLKSSHHPILEAYRDYITSFRTLYRRLRPFEGILPKRLKVLMPVSKIAVEKLNQLEPIPLSSWDSEIEGSPRIDVPGMFELAVRATAKIIESSESFFRSEASNSRGYLKTFSQIPYLDENYNFDTGLPSRLNPKISGQSSGDILRLGLPHLLEIQSRI